MDSKIQNIYISKFLIIAGLISVSEFIVFLCYTFSKLCAVPLEYWLFLIVVILLDLILVNYYKNLKYPYIRISNTGIEWRGLYILWTEIDLITLRYASMWDLNTPRSDRGFPYLEIKTKQATYKIGLKLLTDGERRKLLDTINEYDTVMYKRIKYTSNYMTHLMIILGIVFVVANLAYIYTQPWR
jgi:hypothetical protein